MIYEELMKHGNSGVPNHTREKIRVEITLVVTLKYCKFSRFFLTLMS